MARSWPAAAGGTGRRLHDQGHDRDPGYVAGTWDADPPPLHIGGTARHLMNEQDPRPLALAGRRAGEGAPH
jgi:hypothetical protein